MPHFDIIRRAEPSETFRVKSVMGTYDMTTRKVEEHFVGDIDLPNEWNIGLIVGRSGSGKTTIARELFGDCIISGYEYTHESILDDMPAGASVSEISQALTSVGFASPPLWKCVSIGRKQTRSGAISLPNQSGNRITASFEYIGRAAAPKRQDDKSINENEHAR